MSRVTLVAAMSIFAGCAQDPAYEPRNGDIVFQTSRSSQSLAILILPFGQRSRRGTATRFRWTRLSFHR